MFRSRLVRAAPVKPTHPRQVYPFRRLPVIRDPARRAAEYCSWRLPRFSTKTFSVSAGGGTAGDCAPKGGRANKNASRYATPGLFITVP